MTESLDFGQPPALQDLLTFVRRARALAPDGAARFVAHADVLAVSVSAGEGVGQLALGLRIWRLRQAQDFDRLVSFAALADRFARIGADEATIALPPVDAPGHAWAGLSPPRTGWQMVQAAEGPSEHEQQVMAALGFAKVGESVSFFSCGPWRRRSGPGGHLLTRPDPLRPTGAPAAAG